MPVERVRAWGFVMAVLSEVWNSEGGTVGTRALDVASNDRSVLNPTAVLAAGPRTKSTVPPRWTNDSGSQDWGRAAPLKRTDWTYGSVLLALIVSRTPLPRTIETWVKTGLPSSISARPGTCGKMPIAAKTYQALIVPRSSLPGSPAGPVPYAVSTICRTVAWVFHGWPSPL